MKSFFNRYILSTIIACTTLTGCSDWLDVNDNPNTAQEIDAKYLFSYASVYWSGSRCEDLYNTVALSLQSLADGERDVFFGGYYEVVSSTPFVWDRCYITTGNNLQLALEQLKKNGVKQPNAEAQCKIVLAMQFYEATLLFGDIPFTEAMDTGIKSPRFDSQKDVLNGIIFMLDEALNLIDTEDSKRIDDYDIFYNGDMAKWKALANSLKFRTLIVMADADPSKTSEIKNMMETTAMVSSADENMAFRYSKTPGNENPKYNLVTYLTGNTNLIFFANNNILGPMKQYNDSRIPRYFTPLENGQYGGINIQDSWKDDQGKQRASALNDNLFRADWPDLIYSYQEQLLLEAEVYARGLGVAQDLNKADKLYRAGVKAACNYYQADASATETFLANLPDLSALSPEKALYEIHLQQWIDLMDRPVEAFVQWRRSGRKGEEVPALTVPRKNPHPDLIRRWEYPADELNSNSNAPKHSPKLWETMWFDL